MDLREALGRRAEVRHPWETSRGTLLLRALDKLSRQLPPGPRVLDFGSGDCYVASRLATQLPGCALVCFDAAYTSVEISALGETLPANVTLTASQPREAYDIVLLLDVLEHVQDDDALLREVAGSNLVPGGCLFLTVPTIPLLFSGHDRRLGHYRRYGRPELLWLLTRAGFQVEVEGGIFASLVLPRAAQVLAERTLRALGMFLATDALYRRFGASVAAWSYPKFFADFFAWVFDCELRVETWLASRGLGVVGLSHLVIARKGR